METPKTYRCDKCGTRGVKLWRGIHGCADEHGHKLKCASCLAPEQTIDSEGKGFSQYDARRRTDQVNEWLPAVPVDDTFLGYSSVPQESFDWWKSLPTYP